jgi:glycosyltransferase
LKSRLSRQERKDELKVTIITVCYNSASTIYHTLTSVQRQSYKNIEHIVVDGGSTDNTVSIVNSFPHVSAFISEKDGGIYDAMNKGIAMATGDVVGILNSDDIYIDQDVISKVADAFERQSTDTVYGDLEYVDSVNTNRILRKWKSGRFRQDSFKYGWMPPHPTFFVRREVYEKVGRFNLSFNTAADYEMMLRILFKHNCSTHYLPEVLVKMRMGGASNGSVLRRLKANREDRLAWKINNLKPYFFTLYLKPVRKIFQFVNREQMRRIPIINALF